ncbi:MAG: porin, partial [bacterium]|nr:porin [bacterium]
AGYAIYNSVVSGNANKLDVTGYGEFHINPEFQINSNNKVGAYIELETHPDNEDGKKDKVYKETYVYSEGNYGRFEIGRAKNISRKMHVTTPDVGILDIDDSEGLDYILTPNNFVFINSTAINTDEESNKINYISPSFKGLQIAGSYIPGANNTNGDNTIEYSKYKRGFTTSLKYSYVDTVNFAISFGYGRFDETNLTLSNAKKREEYSVGAKYYVRGLQFTASYKNIVENDVASTISQDGYALNYGIAYEIGPFAISLSNHQSNVEGLLSVDGKDKLYLSLLSTKYTLTDGVDFSVSAGRIAYDAENEPSSIGVLAATGFVVNF